jgi:hypothetical protein
MINEYRELSRESGEKKCGQIAPRTHSDGPVSQTCLLRLLRRELLRAFATLDDSTPQRRISELRVWSYEPFIVFAPSSSGYTSGQNLEVLYIQGADNKLGQFLSQDILATADHRNCLRHSLERGPSLV